MPPATHPPLFATLRSFPRGVWFLFLGSFLNKFGTFVVPFLTLYMVREGYSLEQVGVTIGAYGAGNLFSAAVGGHLADTLGRRKTIVLSMVLAAVGMMLLSQATTFFWLTICSFVVGFSGEMYRPAASALLIDLVPEHQRATAFAAYRVAFNAGWMFGPATAGFLASYDYLWLFVGDAATCLLFGIVAWFALPKGVKVSEVERGFISALKVVRRDRAYLLFLLALFGPGILLMQTHATYSTYVVRDLGFSEKVYGQLLSLNGLLIILFELPITSVTQRYPIRRMMALGFLLLGIGLAMSGLGGAIWILIIGMSVHTLGEMIAFPLMGGFVAKLAPPDMRGRYMGFNGCVWSLSMTVGPGMGLTLYGSHSGVFWWMCAVLGALASAIILIEVKPQPQEGASEVAGSA